MEIWKTIPGYSMYEASNNGQLRSLNYKRSGKTIILKPAVSNDGYLKTMLLSDVGKYRSKTVHHFIALAYLGWDGTLEINHIDGNKLNNTLVNLELVTRSENILHAYRNNLITASKGSINGNSKLTESDVLAIRLHAKLNSPYYGRRALAEKYGVSEGQIKDIIIRRRNIWPHV